MSWFFRPSNDNFDLDNPKLSVMKKILVPTDFSDNAWDALTYAIRLYDDIPCTFYILNTYQVISSGAKASIHTGASKKLYELLKEDSEKGLEKIENHLNEYLLNDKHDYKIISRHGSVSSVIKEISNSEHIDLVVMGTTGASGIKEIFIGSNTVSVINTVKKCPLIAVPNNYEFKEPELISFATDLKKLFTSKDLNPLIELLLIHNLHLEILHVKKERMLSDTQQQNIANIKEHLGNDTVSYKEIDLDISISNSIAKYVNKNSIDILCMANYRHTLMERLTREAVIKKLGFHTEIPLLVIAI